MPLKNISEAAVPFALRIIFHISFNFCFFLAPKGSARFDKNKNGG